MSANVESMAYVGDTPWHGLGNRVDQTVTTDEMLVAAGLDWEVGLASVKFYPKGEKSAKTDRSHNVMYRADTQDVLDIVGPGYVPTQNHEILEFFREYVEAGDMTLETAGALNNGRQVWALAKVGADFALAGDDKVEGYVLLANPHVYGKGMVAKFTAVRVVCHNTYTTALNTGSAGVKLWHSRQFNESYQQEAKQRLGIARDRLDAMAEDALKMQSLVLDEDDAVRLVARVFKADEDKVLDEQKPTVKRVMQLYSGAGLGATLPSSEGTGWGVFGAVTEFLDWHAGRSANNRLASAWFGTGEVVKRTAYREIMELATK